MIQIRLLLVFLLALQPFFAGASGTHRVVEADFLSGGSQAFRNYIKNGEFERSAVGVSAYDDGAAAAPVDMTGGSPGLTCTRTTSSPLAGDGSLLITHDAADRQGEGCSIPFTIDPVDQGKNLAAYFSYEIASGTYASEDISVYVYDVTNGALVPVTNGAMASTTKGDQEVTFISAANSTSYRIGWHVTTATATAYSVKVDRLSVGPNRNIGTVAQTTWLGSIKYAATAGCTWTRTGAGSDSFGNFSADTDCAAPTASGSAADPGSKIPAIKFASVPAGRLVCTAVGSFEKSGGASGGGRFRFSDGTNASSSQNVFDVVAVPVIQGEFTYTTAQSNVTINIQSQIANTSNSTSIAAAAVDLEISCKHYPLASEQVARIGQGADLLGTMVPTTLATCPAGTLKADGSAIPSQYSALINKIGANTPNMSALVPRGTGTQSVNGRTKTGPTLGTVQEDQMQGHVHQMPVTNTVAGANRYLAQASIAANQSFYDGSLSPSTIGPASDGTNGTPRYGAETRVSAMGVTWCVVASHAYQPLIKQAVTTDAPDMRRIIAATLSCQAASSITDQMGDGVFSIGNISSGTCAVTISPAFSSAKYYCAPMYNGAGPTNIVQVKISGKTASGFNLTGVQVNTGSSTVAAATVFNTDIMCIGPK